MKNWKLAAPMITAVLLASALAATASANLGSTSTMLSGGKDGGKVELTEKGDGGHFDFASVEKGDAGHFDFAAIEKGDGGHVELSTFAKKDGG